MAMMRDRQTTRSCWTMQRVVARIETQTSKLEKLKKQCVYSKFMLSSTMKPTISLCCIVPYNISTIYNCQTNIKAKKLSFCPTQTFIPRLFDMLRIVLIVKCIVAPWMCENLLEVDQIIDTIIWKYFKIAY